MTVSAQDQPKRPSVGCAGTAGRCGAEAHPTADAYENAEFVRTGKPKPRRSCLSLLRARRTGASLGNTCTVLDHEPRVGRLGVHSLEYRTVAKRIAADAESRGDVMLDQFTPTDIDPGLGDVETGSAVSAFRTSDSFSFT
jgi:hypothetical protein